MRKNVGISIKLMSILCAIIVLINNSVLNIELGNFYYVILILPLFPLLIFSRNTKIDKTLLLFIIACIFSISTNEIPFFYKPTERLIAFILLIALVGPLIKTQRLDDFKRSFFKYLNNSVVFLTLLAFLGLILNSSIVYLGRGGFTGFFNHSMFLSPMAATSALICYYHYRKTDKIKIQFYFILGAIFSFIVCLAAGSRTALIALLISLLYFTFNIYKRKIKQYLKVIFLIVVVSTSTYPLWRPYMAKINEKMEYAKNNGGLTGTRDPLWQRRLNEFNTSPIFGIGFANDSSKTENDSIISDGKIEPGSSWLAILAMTGIFGFVLFVIFIFKRLRLLFKNPCLNSYFLSSLLIFYILHMIAEGYILSAGSGLFLFVWLLLGNIDANYNSFKTVK